MASQPSQVTRPGTRSLSQGSSASASGFAGSLSLPRSASSISFTIVSVASFLFVPITPDGPRLIQPTAYSPGVGCPSSSVTRPPAVADRAQHQPALEHLFLPSRHRLRVAAGVQLDPIAHHAQRLDRVVGPV